jgi:hypothetical protein
VTDTTQTFNTPLEAGLRGLFLLVAADRRSLDVQQLMYLDYAMVHTADFDGPPSLHPRSPSQGSQLLVRRALIQDGLDLMRSRDLVERRFLAAGIAYRATASGRHLAGEFTSSYAALLRNRAAWAVREFGHRTEVELARLFARRVRPLASELLADQGPGTAPGASVYA